MRNCNWLLSASLLLVLTLSASAVGQTAGKSGITVRGKQQDVYYLPGRGAHRGVVVFLPGDGGWRGFAMTMAQNIADAGYDVCTLDTRVYLESFTTRTTKLHVEDIPGDLRQVATWALHGRQEVPTLVGWSEGAGLGLAALAKQNKSTSIFDGLVTIGMVERNVLGWRLADYATWATKKMPNEPTFNSADLLPSITQPIVVINSSGDEFVTADAARRLYQLASGPKKFIPINARDHRFGGSTQEFFQALNSAIEWIQQTSR